MILTIGPVRFITHISDGKTDDNKRISTELNSVLSSSAMDISSEDSKVSSQEDELHPDYTTNKPEPLVVDSSEIELVDSDSKAVILLDEVMGKNISEEKIDDIDDLLLIEEIDDDGADALQDFLQNND